MKRLSRCFLVLVLCHPTWASQIITENVQKAIVFLYPDVEGQPDQRHPLGTGFLIIVPVKSSVNPMGQNTTTTGQLLLITARHIVDPNWAFCSGRQPTAIYVRVNKVNYDPLSKESGVDYVRIPLVANRENLYWTSDDDEIDAAVIPIGAQLSSAKHDALPMRLVVFASTEEISKIQVGDPVFSAGLLPGKSGEKRNYPFFKFGYVSSIPGEPLGISCEKGMPELRHEKVWFIAANIVAGNSGSPIYYGPPSPFSPSGPSRVVLIGVQSSSFEGADVAGMTPIEDVFKIIQAHVTDPRLDLWRGDETKRTP
ncbi:MAG: hypothetical protein WCB59_19855 [Candidatus Sulfotelmatobacter sp.]